MRSDLGPPSILADAGAAASEYYSIAKLVPLYWQRWRLLAKALWNCNAAIESGTASDVSGLLDIRGHVKLRMGNPVGGLFDLTRALAVRRENAEGPGRIGESEAHLGRALAQCRLNGKAERLLQSGVANLRLANNRPFLIQALRHLGTFYARVGRREEAVTYLDEARQIALRDDAIGQLQQIESELRGLGALPDS